VDGFSGCSAYHLVTIVAVVRARRDDHVHPVGFEQLPYRSGEFPLGHRTIVATGDTEWRAMHYQLESRAIARRRDFPAPASPVLRPPKAAREVDDAMPLILQREQRRGSADRLVVRVGGKVEEGELARSAHTATSCRSARPFARGHHTTGTCCGEPERRLKGGPVTCHVSRGDSVVLPDQAAGRSRRGVSPTVGVRGRRPTMLWRPPLERAMLPLCPLIRRADRVAPHGHHPQPPQAPPALHRRRGLTQDVPPECRRHPAPERRVYATASTGCDRLGWSWLVLTADG
jgi:hypothetical protein